MSKITRGEQFVLAGGFVLFILAFIKPWAKLDLGGLGDLGVANVSGSANAWQGYGLIPLELGILVGLAAAALVVARLAGLNLNLPPVTYLVLGGLSLLLVLLAVLAGPEGSGIEFAGAGIKRGFMLFVAIIPAAAAAYGGYLYTRETGAAPGPSGPTTVPPAPPA